MNRALGMRLDIQDTGHDPFGHSGPFGLDQRSIAMTTDGAVQGGGKVFGVSATPEALEAVMMGWVREVVALYRKDCQERRS